MIVTAKAFGVACFLNFDPVRLLHTMSVMYNVIGSMPVMLRVNANRTLLFSSLTISDDVQ